MSGGVLGRPSPGSEVTGFDLSVSTQAASKSLNHTDSSDTDQLDSNPFPATEADSTSGVREHHPSPSFYSDVLTHAEHDSRSLAEELLSVDQAPHNCLRALWDEKVGHEQGPLHSGNSHVRCSQHPFQLP